MVIYAFDLDGTLADFGTAEKNAIRSALCETLGHEPTDVQCAAFRNALHERAVAVEGAASPEVDAAFWGHALRAALETGEAHVSTGRLLRIGEIYREITLRDLRLYPEAGEALALVAGEPLLLLTNGFSLLQRAKLRALGIADRFR